MGFGRNGGGGGVELALLGKVHISKYINFPNPVFANNAFSPWTTAKDGKEVKTGKLLVAKTLA